MAVWATWADAVDDSRPASTMAATPLLVMISSEYQTAESTRGCQRAATLCRPRVPAQGFSSSRAATSDSQCRQLGIDTTRARRERRPAPGDVIAVRENGADGLPRDD